MTPTIVKATKPRSWLWLQGLLCGGALSLFPAASLVVAALFAPAVLAIVSERTARKPVGKAMAMMALASAISPLHALLQNNSMTGALSIVSDPVILATSWLAAASAWVIGEATTIISYEIKSGIHKHQTTMLMNERISLEEEWGA